jgi:hypothetical protein
MGERGQVVCGGLCLQILELGRSVAIPQQGNSDPVQQTKLHSTLASQAPLVTVLLAVWPGSSPPPNLHPPSCFLYLCVCFYQSWKCGAINFLFIPTIASYKWAFTASVLTRSLTPLSVPLGTPAEFFQFAHLFFPPSSVGLAIPTATISLAFYKTKI